MLRMAVIGCGRIAQQKHSEALIKKFGFYRNSCSM